MASGTRIKEGWKTMCRSEQQGRWNVLWYSAMCLTRRQMRDGHVTKGLIARPNQNETVMSRILFTDIVPEAMLSKFNNEIPDDG